MKEDARMDTMGEWCTSRTASEDVAGSDRPLTPTQVSNEVLAERERCARIAEAMALNPWGVEHEAITPAHLAQHIARAIRG